MRSITLLIVWFCSGLVSAQPAETEQQKSMAKQMATYMDMAWDAEPEPGMANIRFLFTKDGKPYAGVVSVYGRFDLLIQGRGTQTTSVNPNANGRYVYENLSPGTYKLSLTGRHEEDGFKFELTEITLSAGDTPVIEVELD